MTFEELISRIERLFQETGLDRSVELQRKLLGEIERLVLTRQLDEASRYLRITPVTAPGRSWDFEVLGGAYGHADPGVDFDGRRGGSGEYVLDLVKAWLVDLAAWDDVVPYD